MSASNQTAAHRIHLRRVAEEIRAAVGGHRHRCIRSAEWHGIPHAHRMAVMLLAGVDGDLSALARRSWPEFSDNEKLALQSSIRSLGESLAGAHSLRVRAL